MERSTFLSAVLGSAAVMLLAQNAAAQNFYGNNTAFDPEISVVESGAKLDAQAVVSPDRKYVTLTMQPQVATLIALREFTFQGPGGFVGMPNGGQQQPLNGQMNRGTADRGPSRTGGVKAASPAPAVGPLMPALARPAPVGQPPVLHREGMTKVAVLPAPGEPAGTAK